METKERAVDFGDANRVLRLLTGRLLKTCELLEEFQSFRIFGSSSRKQFAGQTLQGIVR